jgi:DNA-directed RNA polymerase subunit RPC12/RpoP
VSRTRAYRCLNCLEHTIDREFDTSHLSVTCPNCESFERFVNEAVFRQFEAFEASPPPEFDWNRLDRVEKLMVAERLVRSTKTLDDFEVVDGEAAAGDGAEGDTEERAEEAVTATEDDAETAPEPDETAEANGETA